MSPSESSPRPDPNRVLAEQVFFKDPALDRMMGVVLALATEHAVARDRLRAVEQVLVERGLLEAGALDASPSAEDAAARQQEASAFAEALMRPLLGVQQARGATGTFSLSTRGGRNAHE